MILLNENNYDNLNHSIKNGEIKYGEVLDSLKSSDDINMLYQFIKIKKYRKTVRKNHNNSIIHKIFILFDKYPKCFDFLIYLCIEDDLKFQLTKYAYKYLIEKKDIIIVDILKFHIKKNYIKNSLETEKFFNEVNLAVEKIIYSSGIFYLSEMQKLERDFNFNKEADNLRGKIKDIFSFSYILLSHPLISFENYLEKYKSYNDETLFKIAYSFNGDQIVKKQGMINFEKILYKYSFLILLKKHLNMRYENHESYDVLFSKLLNNIEKRHGFIPEDHVINKIVISIKLFIKGEHLNIFDVLPIIESFYKLGQTNDKEMKDIICENSTLYSNEKLRNIYLRNNSIYKNKEEKEVCLNIKNNFFHNNIHEEHCLEIFSMYVYDFLYSDYINSPGVTLC